MWLAGRGGDAEGLMEAGDGADAVLFFDLSAGCVGMFIL